MAESSLWSYLKKGMKPYWGHTLRIECILNKGVADVSYYFVGNGWIELKEVKKLPTRPTTGIKLGRWHDLSQRHFLIKRRGWLLIRVNYPKRCYVLFKHQDLPPDEKPLWTWSEWEWHAQHIWNNRINFEELAAHIRKPA